ncbi:carboxypeptidase-like regulatory domain-containing protein [Hymenobacter sp. DH14]|uniref:Carboxypeptidase-like regulatory domain-containing protein n=1 Tax=Hymenobacter cyanobacteriorum TaxID=2926463 RepID=A0A9X1VG51_9BACT|nr:carboxypeptidase-like regulatory domain-containing protein [Hymenobacter cyanobacteriorum]MCI1188579.1 carboxypeptidase-like regulatory domain-containing protein [Hymenobacter cyanobacteriorum]
MRATTSLHIPQPCHESWDAMTPATAGRHCAACAKTVVDFTLKTDAEILAYLAGAASGRTCGRFAAGQLERPLQRAAPVAPAARWRAWLAALVAVWAVRETGSPEAQAQAATEWRARYWGGPVPATPPVPETQVPTAAKPRNTIVLPSNISPAVITMGMVSSGTRITAPAPAAPLVLRGIVTDFSNKQGLPGVTVLIKGTTIGTSTTADGYYELPVPAEMSSAPALTISLSFVGFVAQERTLATRTASATQAFQLQADMKGMMGEVLITPWSRKLPPAPWHPRAFYFWGKYWLTRPFHRN